MPEVKTKPKVRPTRCRHCNSDILQRWGRITKPVRDTHELVVEVHRYRCCDCGRTFRAYPEGVDKAERTVRLRQLAALTWALGLSLEQVSDLFATFGISLSRTTIWRDGQDIVRRLPEARRAKLVEVLSTDVSDPWLDKHAGGVVILLELKRRKKVVLEVLEETDPDTVLLWLKPLVEELGLDIDVY